MPDREICSRQGQTTYGTHNGDMGMARYFLGAVFGSSHLAASTLTEMGTVSVVKMSIVSKMLS
jgi:hypothetical protein